MQTWIDHHKRAEAQLARKGNRLSALFHSLLH
jgi:hypothetical protein